MDTFLALIIGFVVGILFFVYDNKKGVNLYRHWYNISHKAPLAHDMDLGFVKNQPFSKRVIPALFIAIIFSVVVWFTGNVNLILMLLAGVLMAVGLLVGFYVGPFFMNILPGKLKQANKTLKKIDALEEDLLSKDQKISSHNPETSGEIPKEEPIKEIKEAKKPEGNASKKDDDWRSGVKDFLDK